MLKPITITFMLLGLVCAVAAQNQPIVLNSCDSLDGWKVGSVQPLQDTLTINTDAAWKSEGTASVHVYYVAPPDAKGNSYVSVDVDIAPLDVTKYDIAFDAWTSVPDTSKALYLRAYDASGRCVLSWNSWSGLLKTEKTEFRFVPGENSMGAAWEAANAVAPLSSPVVRLQFYAGTHTPSTPCDIFIDNLCAVPAATPREGGTEAIDDAPTYIRVDNIMTRGNHAAAKAQGTDAVGQPPVFVWDAESIEGIRPDMGGDSPDAKFSINTNPAYISQGKGSLKIESISPTPKKGNAYMAVSVPVAPFDMSSSRALVLDAWTSEPANSKALYVRGYDAKGQCVVSWSSWGGELRAEKTTFRFVPGLSTGSMRWESAEIKSEDRSAITMLRFYTGTGIEGVPFNMYVDNIRTEHNATRTFNNVTEPKAVYPDTTIVADGNPEAIIVVPAGDEWAQLGAAISDAIADATGIGLDVRVADDVTDEELHSINAIMLGSIANNRRLLYPYSHSMVFSDGIYPGAGGYAIRTVHDPWGTGRNLVCIGSTDLEGAKLGVDAFAKYITEGDELIIPRMMELKLTGEALKAYAGALANPPDAKWEESQKTSSETHLQTAGTRGLFAKAEGIGRSYAMTRHDEYARMFVWMIKRTYENYLSDPKTYGGPWGMDSDFHIFGVLPAWDEVEESPAVTDEERMEVTKILFRWVTEVGPSKTAPVGSTMVRFNHQTFPALGCLVAGQYFDRYYHCAEGADWIDVADNTFKFQLNAAKPHCDCNTYQWHTLQHTLQYCLTRPDFSYFENGNFRKTAEYAMFTMNNLGYQVPYGDIGGWAVIGGELHTLRVAEWRDRNGRYQWALNKKRDVSNRPGFGDYEINNPEVTEPTDLLGTLAFPLDDLWYQSFKGADWVPQENAFDKISFRDSFDPNSAYLLLDGLNLGGHGHMDCNAILQWTENERVWLADVDYIKSLPKYHNTLLILKDGQSTSVPAYAELENLADLPTVGVSRTCMRDYAGVDWHRNIVWLKDRLFVTVDQMRAKEAGEYSFRAIWQTIGDVTLDGARLAIDQKGQHAVFAMTPDIQGLLTNDPATGGNWSGYPYASEPVVRAFQGILSTDLEQGEQANLFTALHASGEEASEVQVTRLGNNMAAITGAGDPIIIAVADPDGHISIPGAIEAQAELMVITPQKVSAIAVKDVTFMGQNRSFPVPVDIEVDVEAGAAAIMAPAKTNMTIEQKTDKIALDGTASSQEVRGFMQLLIAAAQPQQGGEAQAAAKIADMKALWTYVEKPSGFLLTDNATIPEGVPAITKITASPEPLQSNIFGGGPSIIDALFNGGDENTTDATMWGDDQEVTIDMELKTACEITSMNMKGWFVTSSSQSKRFQIGKIRLLASDDGFTNDTRTLIDWTDTEEHGNWGAPGHQPHLYEFPNLSGKAKQLRLIVTPRAGTGLYLAELEIWGEGAGLEALRQEQTAASEAAYWFKAVHCADINGDGIDETIAGSSNGFVYCFDANGDLLWKFDGHGPINTVTTVDFNGDGNLTVIAAGQAATVFAIAPDGTEVWTYDVPLYKRPGNVETVFPADIRGDGTQVVIAGADNWRYHALDANGKLLWHLESVHRSTAGVAVDLTGDGKQEVVCGTEYYWWPIAAPDGSQLFGFGTKAGPRVNAVDAGDIDGDGDNEIVFGGAGAYIQVSDNKGQLVWMFNTGDEVSGIICADVNNDGADEIIASSMSFNIYCIDGQGKVLWRTDLGNQIQNISLINTEDGPVIAAACDDGAAYVLGATDGEIAAKFQTNGKVARVTGGNLIKGEYPDVIISSRDGSVYAVQIPRPN